ncbi:MAG: SPOR domain-containing protein [Ignavibacteria bacterium]|nr:SPOR domain-containing protein [Ignavibacteria bacterium]
MKYLFLIFFYISITSCSSTEKTVQEPKIDETYVFDEVPPEDYYTFETPIEKNDALYVVQIGAFSTLDRAKLFADKSRLVLQKDIKVNFNDRNGLYVVQIHPPFESKAEAEKFRSDLWQLDDYNDAWVLEIENTSD